MGSEMCIRDSSNPLDSIQLLTAFVKGKTPFFEFCGIAQTENENEKSVRRFFHRNASGTSAARIAKQNGRDGL